MITGERAKEYVISLKDTIFERYKKDGHNPNTDLKLKEEIRSFLMKDELDEFNDKTRKFDEYVGGLYNEINEINKEKLNELDQFKNTYYNKIGDEIEKLIEKLGNEKNNIEDSSYKIEGISSGINGIDSLIKHNNKNLEYLIENINLINKEFRDAIDVSIKQINENISDHTKEAIKQLEENKNTCIKQLNEQVDEKNKDIILERDERINILKEKINIDFYIIRLNELESNKKQYVNDFLNVDFNNIIKYFIFFGITIGVIYYDFFLSRDIVVKEMLDDESSSIYRDIITNIAPMIFSGGLLLMEFGIKYTNSFFKYFLHILTIGLALFISLTPALNNVFFDGGIFSVYEIVMRLIMFLGIIMLLGYIFRKYAKDEEMILFIKDVVLYPIRLFILIPFVYLHSFFDLVLLKFKKNILLDDLKFINNNTNKLLIELKSIDIVHNDQGLLNVEQIEKKYGNIGIIGGFIKNIDDIVFKMNTIQSTLNGLDLDFKSNKQLIENRIDILKGKIKEYSELFNEEKKKIDEKYDGLINDKQVLISNRKEQRKIIKINFEKNETSINAGIVDGLFYLQQNK